PVAPFAETLGAKLDDLLHDPQDRIADALGLLLQTGKVDVLDPALAHDLARGVFGDDAEERLRAGERGLEIERIAGPRFVGKNSSHLRRAEDVAEDDGIERRRGHAVSPAVSANEIPRSGDLAPACEALEMREHLLDMHDVGVFVMQIEQV